jgi:hypothetical protein
MSPENNNPDNNTDEIAALKNQVFTLLVALIVVSGTLTAYLYRQASVEGKDLVTGQQIEAGMDTNEVAFRTIVNRLVEYGQRHPDFVPVLKKHGITPLPAGPANAQMAPNK